MDLHLLFPVFVSNTDVYFHPEHGIYKQWKTAELGWDSAIGRK